MAQTLDVQPAAPRQPESLDDVAPELRQNVLLTSVNALINWGRKGALWPLSFGLA
jgi:NADH-quinone oxidoreductase subunit B